MSKYSRLMKKGSRNIEGRRAVLESIKAGHKLEHILISNSVQQGSQITDILDLASKSSIPVEWIAHKEIENLSVTKKAQGVIAIGIDQKYCSIEDIIFYADKHNRQPLISVLDGIQDPYNLGAIARSLEVVGGDGIVIPAIRAVGITPGVVRASAGAIEHINVARVRSIPRAIDIMKYCKIVVIGLDAKSKTDIANIDLDIPLALVTGSEGSGISKAVEAKCDQMVSIPTFGAVASLNVSVATGIALFEVARQRRDLRKPLR